MRETRDHDIAFTDLLDSTRLFRELGDGAARDLTFGRDPDSAVVVADEFASRVHAVAEVDTMRFKLIDRSANGTYVAIDGTLGEARVLRGETLLHGGGRISLGRPLADPLAQPIVFRRDQRALFRV